jgi:hypothetical protein
MGGKNVLPLYMEFKVDALSAPYLVSSAKATLWVDSPSEDGLVKAAIREGLSPALAFKEIVAAVVARGRLSEWGNVQPFTPEGLGAAIAHVRDYEMGTVEVLMAPTKKGVRAPEWQQPSKIGVPVRWTSWLPAQVAVVVPTNREFVGLLGHLGKKHLVFAVHNASRGIAVSIGA